MAAIQYTNSKVCPEQASAELSGQTWCHGAMVYCPRGKTDISQVNGGMSMFALCYSRVCSCLQEKRRSKVNRTAFFEAIEVRQIRRRVVSGQMLPLLQDDYMVTSKWQGRGSLRPSIPKYIAPATTVKYWTHHFTAKNEG
ncbi:hypothetical protein EMCRGX_G033060 [Ephydatia muelleri]